MNAQILSPSREGAEKIICEISEISERKKLRDQREKKATRSARND